MEFTCRRCGKYAKKRCRGCATAKYCSRNCQAKDWKLHKIFCKLYHDGKYSVPEGSLFLPGDLLSEVVLFSDEPSTMFSLLLVNKHLCHFINYDNRFFGSKNMVFSFGFKKYKFSGVFRSDPLLGHSAMTREKNPGQVKRKKYFGRSDQRDVFFEKKKQMTPKGYVRNIQIVETGIFYGNEHVTNRILALFPRLETLDLSQLAHIKDSLFSSPPISTNRSLVLKKLDISDCKRLTHSIFSDTGPMKKALEELHIGFLFSSVLKKKLKIHLNKLRKVVIKAPLSGSCNWSRPTIKPHLFHTAFSAPQRIEELQFLHTKMGSQENQKVDLNNEETNSPYFLENFEGLRKLKILDCNGWEERMLQKLTELESLDCDAGDDSWFLNLKSLQRLKLRDPFQVRAKTTKRIFLYLPNLTHLDLRKFSGFDLFSIDPKTNQFGDEDIKFFRTLKVLLLCCDTNYAPFFHSRNGNDFQNQNYRACECQKRMEESDGTKDYFKKRIKKKLNVSHVMCTKRCSKGCERCGMMNLKNYCPKLIQFTKCFECKRLVCCFQRCEKCNRDYCCVEVKKKFGFCGEMCEYEALCEHCLHQMIPCESCFDHVCLGCSSRCEKCGKICCENQCIDAYDDEDDDFKAIDVEDRVCKKCLRK